MAVLTAGQWVPFLAAVAMVELTPGPNMGYLALVASRYGWRAGMATVAGITLGLSAYLAAAVLGIGELAARWPWILNGLRWAGVAYLVWLAADTWRGAEDAEVADGVRRSNLFIRGLVTNLLNPKAAVFYVALLPAFMRADAGSPIAQVIALGAIHLGISVLIHTTIVFTASGAKPALDAWSAGAGPGVVQKLFAAGILAVAIWVAISSRT